MNNQERKTKQEKWNIVMDSLVLCLPQSYGFTERQIMTGNTNMQYILRCINHAMKQYITPTVN